MACEKIKRPKGQICVGDLDQEITIMSRTKATNNIGNIQPTINSADVYTVWAAQDVSSGYRSFDSSNDPDQKPTTDKFTLRYIAEVDITYIIESEGILYEIVNVQPLRRKEFMVIRCRRKGDETVAINFIS